MVTLKCYIITSTGLKMWLSLRTLRDSRCLFSRVVGSLWVGNPASLQTWEWGGRHKALCVSDAQALLLFGGWHEACCPLRGWGGGSAVRCVFGVTGCRVQNHGSQDDKKVTDYAFKVRFSRYTLPLVALCVGCFSTFDENFCSFSSWLKLGPTTLTQTLFACQYSPYGS